MELKSVVSSILAGFLFLINSQQIINAEEESIVDSKIIEETIVSGVSDLEVQLDELYKEVGSELNINYIYVKILHLIAGGKAIYADKRPNIYSEETTNMAFKIGGADQKYDKLAPWAYCPDNKVTRPNGKYLPDAAYNVTYSLVQLMNKRYYTNRGDMQVYFDGLKEEIQTNIIFCEALLEYLGASDYEVNNFHRIYEQILYTKEKDENVLEFKDNKVFEFKDKYKDIITNNGITDKNRIKALEITLSFDSLLASAESTEELSNEYELPYRVGYISRENMMKAALSVIGKVRYVWGGGHVQTGNIRGINPIWKEFNSTYFNENDGKNCIKPTYSWCPIHGIVEDVNGCLMKSTSVYNVEEYLIEREKEIDVTLIKEDIRFNNLLNKYIDFKHGVVGHRLDGLDCSGYAGWIYNQIDTNRNYDSSAEKFIEKNGMVELNIDDNLLLPGDVIAWTGHIVMNIGKADTNNNVYIIVEASPNVVKFGVLYRENATNKEINNAIKLANEANELLGGLDSTKEFTHAYNISKLGYVGQTDEEDNKQSDERYIAVGRMSNTFIDENTSIKEQGKTIKEMLAAEIIQYIIDSYDIEYLTGLNSYKGELFNIDNKVSSENNKDSNKEISVDDTDKLVVGTH